VGTSLLVLSESYYPGWKAFVDGVPTVVHRADIAFRGVLVPDGDHLVRMEFSPMILPISLAVTILTASGLAGMMLAFPGRHAAGSALQGVVFRGRQDGVVRP
jgi:uncharacterized membrane protein YfhO